MLDAQARALYAQTQRALQQIDREARAEARAQAEIAGYVFHELRNDQNAVAGVLEIVEQRQEQQDLPAEEAGMVRDARLHARHAAQVVTNMLDFTKLRAGELVLPTDVPFAVQALCEECCTLVSHLVSSKPRAPRRLRRAAARPLARRRALPPHAGARQPVDECDQIDVQGERRSSAARLYGPTIGSRALAAAAAAGVEACVRFTVTDTGKGVPAELRRRIFEPFASGSDVSSSTGGASLGGTRRRRRPSSAAPASGCRCARGSCG